MSHEGKGLSVVSKEQELRAFVEGLTESASVHIEPPACLLQLAERVLARFHVDSSLGPEDLVSLLVMRLLEPDADKGETSVEALLGAQVKSLCAVLRHRLQQVASEQVPGRSLRKELRAHVKRALQVGVGAGGTRPDALLVEGRYAFARVRAAVAWAVGEGMVVAQERALVDFLLREYLLGVEQVPVEPELLGHEDGQERAEAPGLAQALCVQLGAREARLVARKLGGATLKELAQEEGRGLTTVFEQLRRSEAELARCARRSGASVATTRAALRLMALGEVQAFAA
jgi:hypothetical protein